MEKNIAGSEAPAAVGKGSLGTEPPAANGFLRFSHKKLVLAHFLVEKKLSDTCSECSHYYSVRQYENILAVHA